LSNGWSVEEPGLVMQHVEESFVCV
jgi:hypothetical protein